MAAVETKASNVAPWRYWLGRDRRFKLTAAVVGSVFLGLVLLEVCRVSVGQNFHEVLPGKVYRSAQMSGSELEQAILQHGIRTVVNLRGCCAGMPWYDEESRATQRLDICQEDIGLSAGRLPSASELRRLVEVLDHTEYPILLHCKRGADRTGMSAAIVQLLLTDLPLEQARRQLGPRYGHVAVGRTANLDSFLTLYDLWLKDNRLDHSRAIFRRWLLGEYRGGRCSARLEWCSPGLTELPRGRPAAFKVKATNTGTQPWHFRPSPVAGIHLGMHVWDEQDMLVAYEKFGFFEATVPPGESIVLTVVVPALKKAGRYHITVDLTEEGHCWFFQAGSEPLEGELRVRE